MTTAQPHLYTIPAGVPFAESFAAKLLQQYRDKPEKLSEILVLLPTRRSCRIVRDAFLRQSGGMALLLPRLQTLGDVDEDALALDMAALAGTGADGADIPLNTPPAMPAMRRRVILTQMIMRRPDYADQPDQALALADSLGQLMDRAHTEGLDLGALTGLVHDEDLAEQWKMTVKFLEIVLQQWPAILAENGVIDAADRRNRLIDALSVHWAAHPPAYPVYAAGSTGSIPATGRLLRVIAGMPQGHVILPGLDQATDPASWAAIDDTHPQATLKTLLQQFGLSPEAVMPWDPAAPVPPRNVLAREIMRPAATTGEWRVLGRDAESLKPGLLNLQRIDCVSSEEEAAVIALIFRHVQHSPGKTASLVTFDRGLARRVAGACARYDIVVDDSAGQFLSTTAMGGFLGFCAETCVQQFAPLPLLSLLKHGHAAAGMESGDFRAAVRRLDKVLRGIRPAPGIEGLVQHCAANPLGSGLEPMLRRVAAALDPLCALYDGRHKFRDFVRAHIQAAEAMATSPTKLGRDRLWGGDDGEAAAKFFADLATHADHLPDVTGAQYVRMLATFMRGIQVRPNWGTHPRLSILGPMEARALTADLVILGGMNEGSWPGTPENDPWMSRPMRRDFGLPSPERGLGLSAHDFVQGFCAPEVIITRAERVGTAPAIPSRWLQRLDAVLQAAGLGMTRTDWLDRARALDRPADIIPFPRPAPRPPVEKRPVCLSVTAIETWMRDPYSLYAKHILDLYRLDSIDEILDASDRGTVLHTIMEEFIRTSPNPLPDDALARLKEAGHAVLDNAIADIRTRHFWGVRFEKLAEWFVSHEHTWRMDAVPVAQEISGTMILPGTGFTLKGKADRIDRMRDGAGWAIIDYKTGAVPDGRDIINGLSPQLPLEAGMVQAGAFPGIEQDSVAYIGHWVLSGSGAGGEEKQVKKAAATDLGDQALKGLAGLVTLYSRQDTPYYSLPRPSAKPRYNDYVHLARVQEWSVLDDSGEGGEE